MHVCYKDNEEVYIGYLISRKAFKKMAQFPVWITEYPQTKYRLCILIQKSEIQNASKLKTFWVQTDMMPQVEDSTPDLMWWVAVKMQSMLCFMHKII